MAGTWMKMGQGGSYQGYYKLRNPINKVSSAQRAQRAKFRSAAIECSGKKQADFRDCMSKHL